MKWALRLRRQTSLGDSSPLLEVLKGEPSLRSTSELGPRLAMRNSAIWFARWRLIGHAVEFDWSWEGAIAFRPLLLKEFEDSEATSFENGSIDPDIDDSIVWSGEVLEVDEATGRIFVVVANPEHPPRRGSFYVRPFEFLQFLDRIFNEPEFTDAQSVLSERLLAAEGNVHPPAVGASAVGLNPLKDWWRKSWSVLWGPPGTGKT
ncbi:MAG: hypothetical protein R3C05_07325 [Pirellulaceae bacterium]